ncbi:MAG TPA: TolC family protein [Steroidobacteraceae bacterium]|nr:TolC family protein [Steroidobacteraceae bacterium]
MTSTLGMRRDTGQRTRFRLPQLAAIAVFGLVAMSGCTVYHAQPLTGPDTEASLESPDRAQLAQDAQQLRHPRIQPLKLDFTRPLTGEEVEVIAVLANPDLRALRTQQGVAQAQVFASGLLPDPQISLGYDKLLSPVNQGFSDAYAGSVTLDLLGALATRPLERQAATATAEQLRNDIAWQEWTTAGQARLLAVRLFYQRQVSELAGQAAELAGHALQRALAAAQAGDLAADDIELRRVAASEATERALSTARDAQGTRLDLNQILGLQPQEMLSLADPPPVQPWKHLSADALFVTARAERLDLAALAQGYASQEASTHRAVLGQYPRLGITINRASDTSAVHTLGPAVTFDLPLWNRNRGSIATARADRTRLRAEFAARLHQTRAEIADLIDTLDHDEQAHMALAAQLPGIEQVADRLATAASRRDVPQPVAEAARSTALDKRITLLGLEQSCAEERIALTLAIGSPVADVLEGP